MKEEHPAGFRHRNKDISLRKTGVKQISHGTIFYYSVRKNKFLPFQVYNVDKSALSTIQRPQKIFTNTRREPVAAIIYVIIV